MVSNNSLFTCLITSLVVGLVAALVGPAVAQERPNPPRRTVVNDRVVVPMDTELVKPSIRITINGHGPYRFLLDTGAATPLIINDDLVEELELTTRPGGMVGDPSNSQAIQTVDVPVERVGIGGAVFEQVTAISWDRTALYAGDDAPRGIVGLSLFHEVLLTFDYPAQQVVIEPGTLAADAPGVIPYRVDRGVPVATIQINGTPFPAHLDTGSMGSVILPKDKIPELKLKGEPKVVGHGRTVNSEFEILGADLDGTLAFGPLTLQDPRLGFNSVFDEVVAGSDLFRQLRMTFDQKSRRLRIEAAKGGVVQPQGRRSYGLMVDPRGNPPKVRGVVEGSVAERAGLQAGDVILQINGAPTKSLVMGDIAKAFRQDSITLLVDRAGTEHTVTMKLEQADADRP